MYTNRPCQTLVLRRYNVTRLSPCMRLVLVLFVLIKKKKYPPRAHLYVVFVRMTGARLHTISYGPGKFYVFQFYVGRIRYDLLGV